MTIGLDDVGPHGYSIPSGSKTLNGMMLYELEYSTSHGPGGEKQLVYAPPYSVTPSWEEYFFPHELITYVNAVFLPKMRGFFGASRAYLSVYQVHPFVATSSGADEGYETQVRTFAIDEGDDGWTFPDRARVT